MPPAALFDMGEMMMYDDKHHLNAITLLVTDDKQVVSVGISSPNLSMGHFSGVGRQKLDLTAMDAKHVAGRIYLEKPDDFFKNTYIYDVQTKNIKVTGGAVDGDTATLLATGKDGDATSHGTITMVREGGAWKMSKESWKTKSE